MWAILHSVRPSPEIEAIVRRWIKARTEGDIEALHGVWSTSEHVVSVGNAEHEWWFGPSEPVRMGDAHVTEAPAQRIDVLRLHAFEHDQVGWAVSEQRRVDPSGREGVYRQTLIFVLEAGVWKLVHNHFSAPVPNLEAWGTELSRTLSDLVDSIAAEPELTANVRGTVTLVFTDVVDSTARASELGDGPWTRVITAHLQAVAEVAEDEGGIVVKTLGDGGMFVFDSGSAALRAAAKIQHTVAEGSDPKLKVRVGVHTGDVVRTADDYVGRSVAKAARVAAAAKGGEILVSSSTVGIVDPTEFTFGDAKTFELKGLGGLHELLPLDWV